MKASGTADVTGTKSDIAEVVLRTFHDAEDIVAPRYG
jgi:hypothetical protein